MKIFILIGKVCGSIALMYLVSRSISVETVVGLMKNVSGKMLALSFLVHFIVIGLATHRLSSVIEAIGQKSEGLWYLFRLTLIGQFLCQALPSTVGGDGFRVWHLHRIGLTIKQAAHSILEDRLAGLLSLLLFIFVTFPVHQEVFQNELIRSGLYLALFIGFGAFAAILVVSTDFFRRLADFRILREIRDLACTTRFVFCSRHSTLPLIGFSIAVLLADVLGVYLLALSLDMHISYLQLMLLVPAMHLVTVIPITVAGWGLREGFMLTVLVANGISADAAVTLSVCYGLSLVTSSLPGGVLLINMKNRTPGISRLV